jgi:transcriptional activator SPT8
MEDVDDAEGEIDADADAEAELDEEENDENDADENEDDDQDGDEPSRQSDEDRPYANGTSKPTVVRTSASPRQGSAPLLSPGFQIKPPEAALNASSYDILPTIAAPQSTSINALTATPDMRYVYTGGADGYVREFNWTDTVKGKTLLTVAQRHPFVDSVTKAGVLMSYWENEEPNRRWLLCICVIT